MGQRVWRTLRVDDAKRACARVLLFIFLVVTAACGEPPRVDRVTVSNPTDYDVLVEVRGQGPSWLALGVVGAKDESAWEEVTDMGEVWTFRFRYAGEVIEETRISRSNLERQRWRYNVPASVGSLLSERGYLPSP